MSAPIATAPAPYRSAQPAGRDGFAQLLHAEWTKFRTVRGWTIGCTVAALLVVLVGVMSGAGSHSETCINGKCTVRHPHKTLGPNGKPVVDSFYFVHQTLAGDGSITARVTAFTGALLQQAGRAAAQGGGNGSGGSPPPASVVDAVQPWAKAGIIVKASTAPGSAYAAVMATGSHGVRMQYDFTHDVAGPASSVSSGSPVWLRLTRAGDLLTGATSSDGVQWTTVGSARLSGLASSVQVGLLVASPGYEQVSEHLGGSSGTGGLTTATASFDHVDVLGGSTGGSWAGDAIGADPGRPAQADGGYQQAGGTFTVHGSGNIAPDTNTGPPIEHLLTGTFIGLVVFVVIAAMFVTAEYRRDLIRTTFAASPRRGRVLAAKALVLGGVTFVSGVIGAALALGVGEPLLRSNGNYIYPLGAAGYVRIVVGSGLLLAVAGILALSLGAILRRSAGAITAAIVLVVLPFFLAVAVVLPADPARWVLRLTPAAGFAIQQTLTQYSQVSAQYTPGQGYFPLAPWAGFAVLCAYAAGAFGLAVYLVRKRDV